MNRRARLGAFGLMVTGCTSLLATGCRCEDESPAPAEATGQPRMMAEIAGFAERLAKVRAALPPAGELTEQPCPDEDFRLELDGGYADMVLADDDHLARFARPELMPYAEGRQSWGILTAEELRKIEPPQADHDVKRITDTLFRIQKFEKQYRFLAVLRADKKELPREEGGKFHGGLFEGWLVVVELPTAKRLCQASVYAQSSQEVAGYESAQRSAVLWKDFRRHLARALNDSARRLSRRLALVMDK